MEMQSIIASFCPTVVADQDGVAASAGAGQDLVHLDEAAVPVRIEQAAIGVKQPDLGI